MEAQGWKYGGHFEFRRPTITDAVVAGALAYLLVQAGAHEAVAAGVGLVALRIVRWIRVQG
ncbi:hypothetical protein ACWCPM_05555 [Streptomyces sp. NPDC002309]